MLHYKIDCSENDFRRQYYYTNFARIVGKLDKKLVLLVTLVQEETKWIHSMCLCVFQNKMELSIKNTDSDVSTDSHLTLHVFLTQIRTGCQKNNIYLHIPYISDHCWEP